MPSANPFTSCSINGVVTLDCIFPLIGTLISWLLFFAGIIAVFMVIIAGIRFITSGGDPKTVDSAKKTLTYAILGLLIVFFSFFILRIIAYVTNVACIDPTNILSFTTCQ